MATKTISKSVFNADQSWFYNEILSLEGKKLRIEVRRNAYEMQSHAKVELWGGTEWNQLYWLPGCQVKMKRSYVEKGITEADFADDRKELLRVAKALVTE